MLHRTRAAGYARVHYGFEYVGKGPLDVSQPCNAPAFLSAAASLGAGAVVSLETPHTAAPSSQPGDTAMQKFCES